ncbi:MAG: exo-alpha-sialidase [Bacteroidota bacterium]
MRLHTRGERRAKRSCPAKLILCAGLLLSPAARCQTLPENVFIVVIDGIRNVEAFEAGNTYMSFVWDSLRPRGTLSTNFWNTSITVTNAGHSTIVTGARQKLPNNSGIPTPVRPWEPTLGEYYREQTGVPGEKACFISGKNTIWRYPVGLLPGYGYDVAPDIVLASSADTVTWDSARAVMDRNHPSLCYVLFAEVDKSGHTADSAQYLGSIRRVDSLVFLLWRKIQEDSVYRDRTAMLITTDHGRHGDTLWSGHGNDCHDCRHIPFLALGCGIRMGVETDVFAEQIDIAPTVAHLLGFDAPLTQGRVMDELLVQPSPGRRGSLRGFHPAAGERNLSGSGGASRSPDIAMDGTGIHVVYSDDTEGNHRVYYTQSTDDGLSWTPPAALFGVPEGEEYEPAIAADGEGTLLAVSCGFRRFEADSTYRWVMKGRRSTDGGESWGAETPIDTLGTVHSKPQVAASGGKLIVVAAMHYRIRSYVSRDGGVSFAGSLVHGANSLNPAVAFSDTTAVVLWHHLNKDVSPYWNVLANREPWLTGDHPVTNNDSNSYSYNPSVAADAGGMLHAVYADLRNASAGNVWTPVYVRSTDLGESWTSPLEIAPGHTVSSPVVRCGPGGRVYAIWADHSPEGWCLAGAWSGDGGDSWSGPLCLTSRQDFSVEPRCALKGDSLLLVWQDLRDGNWEVYFKQVSLYATVPVPVLDAWNLLSLPVVPGDPAFGSLFPDAVSPAYVFDGAGYEEEDTLDTGVGFWAKFAGAHEVPVGGAAVWAETLDVMRGWNLIGGVTGEVSVSSVTTDPPGLVESGWFGFDTQGYTQAALLQPGKGYWVRMSDAGRVMIGGGLRERSHAAPAPGIGSTPLRSKTPQKSGAGSLRDNTPPSPVPVHRETKRPSR